MPSALTSTAIGTALVCAWIAVLTNWEVLTAKEKKYQDFSLWANEAAQHIEPLDTLPFTPLLSCEPRTSALMDRFDWTIVPRSGWIDVYNPHYVDKGTSHECCTPLDELPWEERFSVPDPLTVWATPHAVHRLLDIASEHLSTKRPKRVVVFSGTEMPLSRAFGRNDSERRAMVLRLKKFFKRIVFQTKDIDLEDVHLAPMGLCWGYVQSLLFQWLENTNVKPIGEAFTELAETLQGNLTVKTRGVLASGGLVATWLESNETIENVKLLAHLGMLMPPSNSSLRAIIAAYESRLRLRRWLGLGANDTVVRNPAAIAAKVEFRKLGLMEWWRELPKYRFLISPVGSGIQAAKNVEALLVLTVPIVQRMGFSLWDELVDLGFPLVVVRGWVEVTAENTSRWWKTLSPRLESFRDNCLSNEGYWRMYTGQITFCV